MLSKIFCCQRLYCPPASAAKVEAAGLLLLPLVSLLRGLDPEVTWSSPDIQASPAQPDLLPALLSPKLQPALPSDSSSNPGPSDVYLLYRLPVDALKQKASLLPTWLDTESLNEHAWPIPLLEYILLALKD